MLADLVDEDPDAVIHALNIAAGDIALLARGVVRAGADGIYLSTQDIGDRRIDGSLHRRIIAPGDFQVLEGAKSGRAGGELQPCQSSAAGGGVYNILHICGYEGHRNKLEHFTDYPAEIINWAAVFEGLPLGKGKELFGGKPVIGGFDNTVNGVLCRGSKAEIQAETRRLLAEAGRAGIILGADCTLPRDLDLQRLQWVREAAGED